MKMIIKTKKQFMFIFGQRDLYLKRLKDRRRRIFEFSFRVESKKARELEDRILIKDFKKIANWNGQVSADLQYNGNEIYLNNKIIYE